MAKPIVTVLINQLSLSRGVVNAPTWRRLRRLARVRFAKVEQFKPGQAARLLKDSEAVVTSWGSPRLDATLLAAAPKLKIIAHAAGSVRPVVSPEVWAKNIVVTSSAAAIARNVAEYAVGCLALGLRRLMANVGHVRAGRWSLDHETGRMRTIQGSRIGVVGAGFVGRRVIELLQPFGPEIGVYDPMLTTEAAAKLGVKKMNLIALARWSHAVTLHAPEIPETNRMIDARFIAALPPNALLVNTARGKLVDEAALITRLKRGDLAAMLDVTDPEPPARTSPLHRLPNVLLTPHVAGAGDFGYLGDYAVTEVERVLGGEPPRYPVTEAMLSKMA